MRKLLIILLIFFSCNNDDGTQPIDTEKGTEVPTSPPDTSGSGDPDAPVEGAVRVTVTVSLPEGAVLDANDLKISSLLTEKATVSDNLAKVDSYDGHAFEMSFAEGPSGNIVMMNYFNPKANGNPQMNANTTALSLIMLQNWTADLSLSAKEQVIAFVSIMPEFSSLVSAIETSLKSDSDPLGNGSVIASLNALIEKLTDDSDNSGKSLAYFDLKEPLALSAIDNTIKIENSSSLAYGVKLNDGTPVYLKGIDKTIYTIVGETIASWFSTKDNIQLTSVSIPNLQDGKYDIYTGNGLIIPSFESSNAGEQARNYNIGKIAINAFNTFSGNLANALNKDECLVSIGIVMVNADVKILEFNSAQGPKEYLNRVVEIIKLTIDNFVTLSKDCAAAQALTKIGLQRAIAVYSVINTIVTGFDTYTLINEAIQYESEIDFCTDMINGDFKECKPLLVSANLSFGKMPVGQFGFGILSLENKSNLGVFINKATFPNGSYTTLPSTENLDIPAGKKIDLLVTYDAKNIEELTGNITIETDLPNEGTFVIPVSGAVIDPLVLMDEQGKTIQELVFENTSLNTPEKKTLILKNLTDYGVLLFKSDTPVEAFNYGWNEQTIDSLGEAILEFTFLPTQAKTYDSPIEIKNGSSRTDTLNLIGTGITSVLEVSIEGNSYDFGQVVVNTPKTKVLSITNRSSEPTRITNIGDTQIFRVPQEDKSLTLEAGEQRNIPLTFLPQETKPYSETIPIVNEAVDNLQIAVRGEGVESLPSLKLIRLLKTSQIGTPNESIPVSVMVVDQNDSPVPNVPVEWVFFQELYGVSQNIVNITTNSNSEGIAETSWPFGDWSNLRCYQCKDYASAYINNGESKIGYNGKKYEVHLSVGGNLVGGPSGTPINGTVSLNLGNKNYVWNIVDSGSGDPAEYWHKYLSFPSNENFDYSGTVTVNLNRSANVNLMLINSGEPTNPVSFVKGWSGNYIIFDGEFGIDSNGDHNPASKTVTLRAYRQD